MYREMAEMTTQRTVGITCVVIGADLLAYGLDASHSSADRASETFTGRCSERTTLCIIGGAAVSLFGLLMVVCGNRDKGHSESGEYELMMR
jgi:hypothetical protein